MTLLFVLGSAVIGQSGLGFALAWKLRGWRHPLRQMLEGTTERRPSQLSGGQQQRVALARAVAYRPKVFLFDEPLSNLDARLRLEARTFLKRLQRDLGITTVYVTHDQSGHSPSPTAWR